MTEHFTYAFLTQLPSHALQDRLRAAVSAWQWTLDRASENAIVRNRA